MTYITLVAGHAIFRAERQECLKVAHTLRDKGYLEVQIRPATGEGGWHLTAADIAFLRTQRIAVR